ncbi:MerR family transcriptional regulator [Schnuerera sp. xch1]|uniref:MerR family transcriptional regulator n=1 Tax=Schnuerera sp. xch1 TaxID=2874283 RepID=UPI001CBD8D5D|nr:MerR family transcriptional regulator [Schnuerera sp. xch1]MBZ2175527.1 MerR family transcriptional regulator [Schnuerera sp. xch1]
MKINKVCNATGLTKKAIDYYQQKKIIDPNINENGYREFNELEVERLKQVSVLRVLGLSVSEIKEVINSKFSKEELRKCIIRKELENELSNRQIQLLKQLTEGKNIEKINAEINELNKKKSIKEKLLETFPGFYGRFFIIHFNRFLEEPVKTEEQETAYKIIVKFLDEVELPKISYKIMSHFEEDMDFWSDDRIAEAEARKQEGIEDPEKFLDDYSEIIEQYQDFKESVGYKSSPYGQLMEAMKSFGKTSGYNDVFIPAMRRLSPSYEEYYQSLLKANEIFVERFPDFK